MKSINNLSDLRNFYINELDDFFASSYWEVDNKLFYSKTLFHFLSSMVKLIPEPSSMAFFLDTIEKSEINRFYNFMRHDPTYETFKNHGFRKKFIFEMMRVLRIQLLYIETL